MTIVAGSGSVLPGKTVRGETKTAKPDGRGGRVDGERGFIVSRCGDIEEWHLGLLLVMIQ